ncbi:MAG: response regulator transcription factor [Hydrococcus sp. SU_1_0]|nr:response regulator transcription factor [Hydrococcus sp. SU_1_0]
MIRIILVDDQRTVRESLKASLKSIPDLEVVGTAGDGQDAIALVRKLHPEVVLVDMEMPGLDGIATTQIICEQFAQVRVIILSMHDEDHYVAQAVRAGAMGYLIKNTPSPELAAAIRSVHRGYAQIGPGLLNKIITVNAEAESVVSNSLEHGVVEQVAGAGKKKNSWQKGFSTASSNPLGQKKLLYLGIWLLGNACLWGGSLLYLKLVSPVYSSNWTIALPGTASSTSVNLPDIGQASSENQSPFSNLTSDPRENYKLLAESEDVVDAAAQSLKSHPKNFGQPISPNFRQQHFNAAFH